MKLSRRIICWLGLHQWHKIDEFSRELSLADLKEKVYKREVHHYSCVDCGFHNQWTITFKNQKEQ